MTVPDDTTSARLRRPRHSVPAVPSQRRAAEDSAFALPGAPRLPRGYVPRRLLWDRLDASTQRAVTMVVAPAGAGKTLGVAGWLRHSPLGRDATWISGNSLVSLRMLTTALDEARGIGDPRIVVIDDAHQLPSTCIRYLDHELGERPDGVRLLLLTRWDLALSRLVPELLGHLSVIRGDVLKLSDTEAHRMIVEHARTDVAAVRDAIVARAQGWCAAVVLAARASAAAPSHVEFIRRCQDAELGVADLVAGEVFASLPSRDRHLLLCTAGEPVLTTETAVHLTRDPRAGEVLGALESTGLLVNREGDGRRASGDPEDDTTPAHFRIHPLLLEVVRRRLRAGGVDVQQAHGTVLRAARLDLARGDLADGFRRLVFLTEFERAAEVLAQHGPRLLVDGAGTHVEGLVRWSGTVLDRHPATWGTIAWARWQSGDVRGDTHWSARLLGHEAAHPGSVPVSQVLCTRLRRTRAGLGSLEDAVSDAREALRARLLLPMDDPFRSMLLLELGAAENWLGDLAESELHLGEAIMVSRADGLRSVTAEALSHLALTRFMAGRERACMDLARQSLGLCDGDPSVPESTRARADVALRLATLQSEAWPAPGDVRSTRELPKMPDDLAGQYWHRVLLARTSLVSGAVADAVHLLELPFEMPALPAHLEVGLHVERALQSLTTGNRDALRVSVDALASLGSAGGRAWAEGALADLEGDLRRAADLYLEASAIEPGTQPPTATMGLVGAAQLHEHLTEAPPVHDLLVTAITLTEPRRNALPFLGWSPHGRRVGLLLAEDPAVTSSPWGEELAAMLAELPGVAQIFRPLVGTPHELGSVVEPAVTPTLSPREREVLGELARGATYADIAANLFVSENTVKTHISSLYSKLSVGRRSEALAVARKLHLL